MAKNSLPQVGDKFGRLTFIRELEPRGYEKRGEFECDCGKICDKNLRHVTRGTILSCGCLKKEKAQAKFTKPVAPGDRFNRWTVLEYLGRSDGSSIAKARFQCDCGTVKILGVSNVRTGTSKSCGCLKVEQFTDRVTKHGERFTPEYKIWLKMKGRCTCETDKAYPGYGGRGIKMCSRWQSDFMNFLEDMGKRPDPKLSIDRIDNELHYSCGHCEECLSNGWDFNCRWADSKTQNRNKRSNRKVEWEGQKITLSELAERYESNPKMISKRLDRGWDLEKAVLTPPMR